jgi:2-oxoglutarate ferredoxin oxidoreductase subunit alpha
MKRFLETGNFAITEGAIMAGCRLFAGYPITPATEIAEAMSRKLPKVGGYYLQAEDECGAMHMAVGAAAGGMKTMTATSGPGFILFADPYGWAIGCEIPIVVLNSQRVGPVSGITGAPGQGEFYNARYPTQGGNYETIVLAPNSAQEAMALTVEAFYLSERFRTPVTILADQLITDGLEDISIPETDEEKEAMGLRFIDRKVNMGPDFYPASDEIDIPPTVLGKNTGAMNSDWTPTEEGYDIETVEAHHKHSYRMIYKIRNHTDVISRFETLFVDDNPDIIVVSFGTASRTVKTAVKKAREKSLKIGMIRPISLWPFPDELFDKKATYLSVEMGYDGQMVREVERAAPCDSDIHFFGKCGELPTVSELHEIFYKLLKNEPLKPDGWEKEVW